MDKIPEIELVGPVMLTEIPPFQWVMDEEGRLAVRVNPGLGESDRALCRSMIERADLIV